MEPYILLAFGRRTGIVEGPTFHTLRRTRWEVVVNVASLEDGGSVTVVLEGSPDAQNDDSFSTLHSFGEITTTGETTVRSFALGTEAADFSVAAKDMNIRIRLTAVTGEYVIESTGTSRFFDEAVQSDLDLLPGVLESDVNRTRFIDSGERDVVRTLMQGDTSGVLQVNDPNDPRVSDLIRDAIIAQALRLQRVETLKNSGKEKERREGFGFMGLDNGAEDILLGITDLSGAVWQGR